MSGFSNPRTLGGVPTGESMDVPEQTDFEGGTIGPESFLDIAKQFGSRVLAEQLKNAEEKIRLFEENEKKNLEETFVLKKANAELEKRVEAIQTSAATEMNELYEQIRIFRNKANKYEVEAVSLKKANDELKKVNEELKKANKELKKANEKLEKRANTIAISATTERLDLQEKIGHLEEKVEKKRDKIKTLKKAKKALKRLKGKEMTEQILKPEEEYQKLSTREFHQAIEGPYWCCSLCQVIFRRSTYYQHIKEIHKIIPRKEERPRKSYTKKNRQRLIDPLESDSDCVELEFEQDQEVNDQDQGGDQRVNEDAI